MTIICCLLPKNFIWFLYKSVYLKPIKKKMQLSLQRKKKMTMLNRKERGRWQSKANIQSKKSKYPKTI